MIHQALSIALFEDYNLLAAVQLVRLTCCKSDRREHPDLAIDEVMSIAGKDAQKCRPRRLSRTEFPTIFMAKFIHGLAKV